MKSYTSNYFRGKDEDHFKRMTAMLVELKDTSFYPTPCPLLASQIKDAIVLSKLFLKNAELLLDGLQGNNTP